MVIVTIVVADLQRKTERNEAGILIGAGRSVRPMTQRYEGYFLREGISCHLYSESSLTLILL
jgi:hypothetical protein